MQTVSQFNQQNADIFRHCQQKLAEIFSLLVIDGLLLNHRQFGKTVNNLCHLLAEQRLDFFHRRIGIFNRIMQKPGNDGSGIKLEFCQNTGHFYGMGIIRVAGSPQLGPVFLHCKDIRSVQSVFIGVRIIGFYQINKFILS